MMSIFDPSVVYFEIGDYCDSGANVAHARFVQKGPDIMVRISPDTNEVQDMNRWTGSSCGGLKTTIRRLVKPRKSKHVRYRADRDSVAEEGVSERAPKWSPIHAGSGPE